MELLFGEDVIMHPSLSRDIIRLWEIFVPDDETVSREHHQDWDRQVAAISGGLTLMSRVRGRWRDEDAVVAEPMIPVRIACTEAQIERIADLTAVHYRQKAVMFYPVADGVRIRYYHPPQPASESES